MPVLADMGRPRWGSLQHGAHMYRGRELDYLGGWPKTQGLNNTIRRCFGLSNKLNLNSVTIYITIYITIYMPILPWIHSPCHSTNIQAAWPACKYKVYTQSRMPSLTIWHSNSEHRLQHILRKQNWSKVSKIANVLKWLYLHSFPSLYLLDQISLRPRPFESQSRHLRPNSTVSTCILLLPLGLT